MSEKSSAGKDEGGPSSAGKEGAGAVKGDLPISKKPIGSSVLSFL
jgi:hypothetical protein